MDDAYADVDEVDARLEWDLDAGERAVCQGALDDLSDWARHYGRHWPVESVPKSVKRLVIRAAARYMRNPDGYEQSRAGDETVIFNHSAKTPGSAVFSDDEVKAIKATARPVAGLMSIQIQAHGTKLPTRWTEGLVPDETGAKFPFYDSDSEPW